MTPERKAELRSWDAPIAMAETDLRSVSQAAPMFAAIRTRWNEMLDEIDRLEAEVLRVRDYAERMDGLNEVRLIEIDRLQGLVRKFCIASEEASLRSIEARNPGIEMDAVRKQRGRVDVEAIIRGEP